jgi:urea transporter
MIGIPIEIAWSEYRSLYTDRLILITNDRFISIGIPMIDSFRSVYRWLVSRSFFVVWCTFYRYIPMIGIPMIGIPFIFYCMIGIQIENWYTVHFLLYDWYEMISIRSVYQSICTNRFILITDDRFILIGIPMISIPFIFCCMIGIPIDMNRSYYRSVYTDDRYTVHFCWSKWIDRTFDRYILMIGITFTDWIQTDRYISIGIPMIGIPFIFCCMIGILIKMKWSYFWSVYRSVYNRLYYRSV